MSWELTSFLILGGVLLAGFAWYERSRPPAQVVALVAALAALAVAGRIAFAAFPNVKPTTDVVIFAGYALGGAPGFAVGALTALVSNIWFGQGPWTPWQMAGWGLCGLLGAATALGRRPPGRLALALVCGLAAPLYGALLNFSVMATGGGELSWRAFGLLEGRAVPFEVAHAVGNVSFAVAAGPAMLRMLVRFRERFEWRCGRGRSPEPEPPRGGAALGGGAVAAIAIALLGLVALPPTRAAASGVGNAAEWLESVENRDGGWGASPGDASGAEITSWAMLGLEAAGRNPLDVQGQGRTPVDFLRGALGQVNSAGDLARTILSLEGAGVDPREFGGENLVAQLLAKRRDNGSYAGWPNSTAFAVIALRAAGVEGGIAQSKSWLRGVQNPDGGWGDVPGSPSTTDGTGAVLQALSGESDAARRAAAYLERHQHHGGGFPLGGTGTVNTQSTAWAVQGLRAAGRNPDNVTSGGVSGPEYLAANQEPDGSYRYAVPGAGTTAEVAHQTPVWVTGEVLVAAAGDFFPLAAVPRKPQPKQSGAKSGTDQGPPPGVAPSSLEPLPTSPSAPPPTGGGLPAKPSSPGEEVPPKSAAGLPPPGAGAGGTGTGTVPGPGAADGSVVPLPEASQPAQPGATAEGAEAANTRSTSALGAIVLGLAAGALLFGLGLLARRGWMRWRYGL